ncbi:MAG: hypothetical protein P8010_07155 [Desulfosarcinaceae bacterium]|jgi:hypothetical protein
MKIQRSGINIDTDTMTTRVGFAGMMLLDVALSGDPSVNTLL